MRYETIDNALFAANRKRFAENLPPKSMAIFVSGEKMPRNGDQFFTFRQQSDFFYLTGISVEKSALILFPDCPIKNCGELLFIEDYNETKVLWEGGLLSREEASSISGISTVKSSDLFDVSLQELMAYTETIYLNDCSEITGIETKQQRFNKTLREKYPLSDYQSSASILNKLRMVKSEYELMLIRKAITITRNAFERAARFTKPNKYEFEVQAEIEHEFTINRSNGNAFPPVVAGGVNACCLHYSENKQPLNDGELLLFDMGAEYANYAADLSRTIPVNGKFTPRQKACYNAVLRTLKSLKKLYVPEKTIDEINHKANELLEKEMIALGLFSEADVKAQNPNAPLFRKYFMHGVAHHIGLDVHDVGDRKEPLRAGMVLSCEPGIYIREEQIGIRIENDILITNGEPIDLMSDIPIEVDEIEKIMKNK
jgi:Xaa-Pro aminopeptidase